MKITRIFTGDDGRSHFEDLEVPLEAATYGELSDLVPTGGMIFRTTAAGAVLDFHVAPRRQFVVSLDGCVEVGCGDGSTRSFGAGDIMLADDTTGQGHSSREVGGTRRSLFIPLPDDYDVSGWRRVSED